MQDHLVDCEECSRFAQAMRTPLYLAYSPKDRHQVEGAWESLLVERGCFDSVTKFCLAQEQSGANGGGPVAVDEEAVASAMLGGKHRGVEGTGASVFTRVFGAKIQAVVQYIHKELKSNPTAKFVAFTEYQSQQHLLGLALHIVNIPAHLVLGSSSASEYPPIRAFKSDPLASVLIMPFSKCHEGINLDEATHVLFIHPYAGPSEDPFLGDVKPDWATGRYPLYTILAPDTLVEQESKDMAQWSAQETVCLRSVVRAGNANGVVKLARFVIPQTREAELASDKVPAGFKKSV
ncbi:hypothetical protein BCR44DRAFT_1432531 [Catenaria anguillulae PL171]|uniref:Helicase C-terminal domain-containing protein n=1 Tax=Catenaria anguillulae PL171 TaxID=765915 RepID=A0A1Y2HP91_9FUNG|nr:hypothetical protein BCR44DRAFT_1432531 [Catenaria anguillulae PL171]